MVRQFQCPVNVSPMIRGARWCMLLMGVVYGAIRKNALQRFEDNQREFRQQMKKLQEEVIRLPFVDYYKHDYVEEISMNVETENTPVTEEQNNIS